MATSGKTPLQALIERAEADPGFFARLIEDPQAVAAEVKDEGLKARILGLNPHTILTSTLGLPGITDEMSCDPTCGGSTGCNRTCGDGSCNDTCGASSCTETCSSSCNLTCGGSCNNTTHIVLEPGETVVLPEIDAVRLQADLDAVVSAHVSRIARR